MTGLFPNSLLRPIGVVAVALLFGLGTVSSVHAEEKAAEGEDAAAAEEAAAGETEATEEAAADGEDEEVDWEDKPYQLVDGKVDFGTYNGYRRYHSDCHVCHGPDGLGSTYAPPLIDSIPAIGYDGYLEAVVNGIQNVSQSEQSVMPSFGENPNVMLYVDDIYSYLKARADGAIGRGRPDRLPKPKDE
ncbi:MAG: c-type cytochrome, methanol metabolism-related [Geminicoccaceae bacterium]